MNIMSHPPRGQRDTTPAFGPQAELCRRTTCCLCWASHVIRSAGPKWNHLVMLEYDWENLPALADGEQATRPHHEPPMGNAMASNDGDTIPLCARHHTDGPHLARHSERWQYDPTGFYGYFDVDWRDVRDEMQLRAKRMIDTKVVGE